MGFDGYVRSRPLAPLTALGRTIQGVVSWNINDTCNYRCRYCTQATKADRSHGLKDPEWALRALAALPGSWEVKLSGGEPFLQPGLTDIVRSLVELGHVISVQTNFSSRQDSLMAFLEACGGALHLFSASLHLEYATAEGFWEKYRTMAPYLGEASFHVTSVATKEALPRLAEEVAPLYRERGIVFKVQPEKVGGQVRAYSPREMAMLLGLGGHNLTGLVAPSYQGRPCYAGSRYLVIKSDGQAYRCYPASRQGGRYARLGSLDQGLTLLDGPRLCPYTYCSCTVPIQRGMMGQTFEKD